MQTVMYDVLTEVQGCRGELDSHIHSLEKHVEEFREGFRSLMPLLSTQNSSIRHLLREREVKTEAAGARADREKEAEEGDGGETKTSNVLLGELSAFSVAGGRMLGL